MSGQQDGKDGETTQTADKAGEIAQVSTEELATKEESTKIEETAAKPADEVKDSKDVGKNGDGRPSQLTTTIFMYLLFFSQTEL
jgi:hypothetical protein